MPSTGPNTMSENAGGSNTDAEYIKLRVIGPNSNEIHFRVKYKTQLGKLKDAYSRRVGIPIGSLQFIFDGYGINDADTPTSLWMEENDRIEVYTQQNTDTINVLDLDLEMPNTMSENGAGCMRNEELLKLNVMGWDSNAIYVLVIPKTRMIKVKNDYSKRFGLPINSLQFLFKGRIIQNEDTPTSLKMKSNDVIYVINQINTEVEDVDCSSDSDMVTISENDDYQMFGNKRRRLSNPDANNRARFDRRHASGISQGGGVSPGNDLDDSRRKGPRRLHKNPKPREEEDMKILDTHKRTLHKSIGHWMRWMENELYEYLHQNEWDSYKTESLKLIIEYKNKSERRRRKDLQAHQQHSQQQHGAGPSGWEPMNSQQQFQLLNQNLAPQPPPQAMPPPRLFPEDSNIITHICHALSTAHGAPRDTNVSIKQEPGLNTPHGTGINTSQGSGHNTSQWSGLNTSEGSETNASVITISHPPNETANGAMGSNRAEGSKRAKGSKGAKGSSKKE